MISGLWRGASPAESSDTHTHRLTHTLTHTRTHTHTQAIGTYSKWMGNTGSIQEFTHLLWDLLRVVCAVVCVPRVCNVRVQSSNFSKIDCIFECKGDLGFRISMQAVCACLLKALCTCENKPRRLDGKDARTQTLTAHRTRENCPYWWPWYSCYWHCKGGHHLHILSGAGVGVLRSAAPYLLLVPPLIRNKGFAKHMRL
jgi:hypothetical protein